MSVDDGLRELCVESAHQMAWQALTFSRVMVACALNRIEETVCDMMTHDAKVAAYRVPANAARKYSDGVMSALLSPFRVSAISRQVASQEAQGTTQLTMEATLQHREIQRRHRRSPFAAHSSSAS